MNVLMYVADHCEDIEAFGTRALLVRSGLPVKTVCDALDKTITTAFGLRVTCDYHVSEIRVEDYVMLIIPGGKYVALTYPTNHTVKALIQAFDGRKKALAAICAGPRFLGSVGLLKTEKYTAFPGSEKDIEGEYLGDEKVVVDGRIITARSAGAVYEFALEIVRYLQGEAQAKWLKENILL